MASFDTLVTLIIEELQEKYKDGATADQVRECTLEILYNKLPASMVDQDIREYPTQLAETVLSRYVRIRPEVKPDILEGNPKDHIDWLEKNRATISWNYWNRYEYYLLNKKRPMSRSAVKSIYEHTDDVLERLENPARNGKWLRKGLVIGYVQSGKTANYTGLICKAADAGYKIIIVLTGISEELRAQTQERLDEGFTGRSTASGEDGHRKIGVSDAQTMMCYGGQKPMGVTTYTTSNLKGDFTSFKTDVYTDKRNSGAPVLLVVKKNSKILQTVINNIKQIADSIVNDKINITDIPLLIIDDEADNASISTRSDSKVDEIKTINSEIRKILSSFWKAAYVGYTATPYANVFIEPEKYSEKVGEDLFPSDFIMSLPEPEGYFGAKQFFGNPDDENVRECEFPGVHIVDESDYDKLIPKNKRKDKSFKPTAKNIPGSLVEAIRFFILSTAVKTVRSKKGGRKGEHNSMLVHITRFSEVQDHLMNIIQNNILRKMKNDLTDGDTELFSIFEELWKSEFKSTMDAICNEYPDGLCIPVDWDDIKKSLPAVIGSIKVKEVNSLVKEKLNYKSYPEGLTVIAVGGNSIARGLTLEGLSVSYFLRDAGSYDTLLQMARWFGFRPGYIDLCHIYIRQVILDKFRLVAAADENLRDQIRRMIVAGKKPSDYGLMVKETDIRSRAEQIGLFRAKEIGKFRATAINKSKSTEKVTDNPYSGKLKQTTVAYGDPDIVNDNLRLTESFIRELGVSDKKPGDIDERYPQETGKRIRDYIWRNVSPKSVIGYLKEYRHHEENEYFNNGIPNYIETQYHDASELREWTVVLIQKYNKSDVGTFDLAGIKSTLSERTFEPDCLDSSILRNKGKKGIVSRRDESIDLTYTQIKEAYALNILEMHRKAKVLTEEEEYEIINRAKDEYQQQLQDAIIGKCYRKARYPKQGLLLIYPVSGYGKNPIFLFGISLPESPTAIPEEYRANKVWLDKGSDFEDDTDEY